MLAPSRPPLPGAGSAPIAPAPGTISGWEPASLLDEMARRRRQSGFDIPLAGTIGIKSPDRPNGAACMVPAEPGQLKHAIQMPRLADRIKTGLGHRRG
jgi:hypothetical protein